MLKKEIFTLKLFNLLYHSLNKCIDCLSEVSNFISTYDVHVTYILTSSGEKEVDLESIKGSFVQGLFHAYYDAHLYTTV